MKKLATLLTALAVISFIGTAFAQLDIGGDIKVLGFWHDNATDVSSKDKDQEAFLRTETHLWFQTDLSENVTTKVSVETDRLWNQDDVEGDQNDLDVFLEEAWIQMMYLYDSAFSVKLGRQFIEFGDGFIVGDSNALSELFLSEKGEREVDPFDAILVWYDGDDWILNLMAAKVVENRLANEDVDLYGAYFSYSGAEEIVFDVYGFMSKFKSLGSGRWLVKSLENVPWVDVDLEDDDWADELLADLPDITLSKADVYWVGARLAGTMVEGLSYKLEGAYQFGKIYGTLEHEETSIRDWDIKAWAVEAGAKYMVDAEYNPWVGLTYAFFTGGKDLDGDFKFFVAPFQNRVYGEIADLLTTSNAHVFNLAGGFDLNEDIAVSAKYYYLMAHKDQMYGGKDEIGHEVDAYLDYQFSREASATLAGGFFDPGKATKNLMEGSDSTAWFLRAGVKVEF